MFLFKKKVPVSGMRQVRKKSYTITAYVPVEGTQIRNFLEGSEYVTDDIKKFVLTGTVGEKWVADLPSLARSYTFVDGTEITEDNVAEFVRSRATFRLLSKPSCINWAELTNKDEKIQVTTPWGEVLTANRDGIPHGDGDYIMASDDNGKPSDSDRWIVNGEVFKNTYEFI